MRRRLRGITMQDNIKFCALEVRIDGMINRFVFHVRLFNDR